MFGCLIGLAGVGSAMAADMDACDATTTGGRGAVDSSARDAGTGGGDAVGLSRDTPAPRRNGDTAGNDADNRSEGTGGGNEHPGRISAPATARPATLGWQSLLPGSIQ
ncbi:hypothetical protein PCA_02330 [Rhodanobacter sp. PCA2]|nr:hypothetical protein [Rhodanobacter sp. PCA2]